MTPTRCQPPVAYSCSAGSPRTVSSVSSVKLAAGARFDLRHQRTRDPASPRPPVHEQLRDVGAMRLVRRPRRMHRHAADDPRVVSSHENERARVRTIDGPAPPLTRIIDRERAHEADARAAVDGVDEQPRKLIEIVW
jgi:hypothetical protein